MSDLLGDVVLHWYRSLAVILAILVLEYRSVRPHFVLPASRIHTVRSIVFKVLKRMTYVCLVLLPLQLQIPVGSSLQSQPLTVQIVLDTSLSMSAEDLGESRYTIAKKMIEEMLTSINSARVGMIIFSGVPVEYILPSQDIIAVRSMVQQLEISDFPINVEFLGTAVGDALLLGLDTIQDYQDSVMILISDGTSSRGTDPLQIAYISEQAGIPIHVISIGTPQDVVIGYDRDGEEVIAQYDTITLQKIADLSKGKFVQVKEEGQWNELIRSLNQHISSHQEVQLEKQYLPINIRLSWMLLLLVGLLLAYKITILVQLYRS